MRTENEDFSSLVRRRGKKKRSLLIPYVSITFFTSTMPEEKKVMFKLPRGCRA
jgi:hypothetical protein